MDYTASKLFTAVEALKEMANHLMEKGTTEDIIHKMVSFDEYIEFVGSRKM